MSEQDRAKVRACLRHQNTLYKLLAIREAELAALRLAGEKLVEDAAALLLAKDSLLAAYRVGSLVSGDQAVTALEVAESRWSSALSSFRATASGVKWDVPR